MTQDVQPLTWQKRTNIEEHMQFFSKINEIIANLAPTVAEAEAAIAQATAAIASANDAIATANAASAAASAAATQAQTAASTVAGYDTRLTAAEGDIDDLQAADQTMAGNIAALGTRMGTAEGNISALQGVQGDYVKKAGAAQTVTSKITLSGGAVVPDTPQTVHDPVNQSYVESTVAGTNNLLHKSGNEGATGNKAMTVAYPVAELISSSLNNDTWYRIAIMSPGTAYRIISLDALPYNNKRVIYQERLIIIPNKAYPTQVYITKLVEKYNILTSSQNMAVAWNATDQQFYLYYKHSSGTHSTVWCKDTVASAVMTNGNGKFTAAFLEEEPTAHDQVVYYDE